MITTLTIPLEELRPYDQLPDGRTIAKISRLVNSYQIVLEVGYVYGEVKAIGLAQPKWFCKDQITWSSLGSVTIKRGNSIPLVDEGAAPDRIIEAIVSDARARAVDELRVIASALVAS